MRFQDSAASFQEALQAWRAKAVDAADTQTAKDGHGDSRVTGNGSMKKLMLVNHETYEITTVAIKLMFLDVEIAANLLQASGSFWTTLGGTEVNLERSLVAFPVMGFKARCFQLFQGASTPAKLPAESQSADTSEPEGLELERLEVQTSEERPVDESLVAGQMLHWAKKSFAVISLELVERCMK